MTGQRVAAGAAVLFIAAALVATCTPEQQAALQSSSPLAVPSQTAVPTATFSATPAATQAPTTAAPTTAPTEAPTEAPTPVPTPVPTPRPTPVPTPRPTPVPTPQPTATPSPAPTASPSPAPTGPFPGFVFVPNASGPTPPPASGIARYGATVLGIGGRAIVGACAYTGPPAGCPPKGAYHTDLNGFFAVDLPSGSQWDFTVEYPGCPALLNQRINAGTTVTLRMSCQP